MIAQAVRHALRCVALPFLLWCAGCSGPPASTSPGEGKVFLQKQYQGQGLHVLVSASGVFASEEGELVVPKIDGPLHLSISVANGHDRAVLVNIESAVVFSGGVANGLVRDTSGKRTMPILIGAFAPSLQYEQNYRYLAPLMKDEKTGAPFLWVPMCSTSFVAAKELSLKFVDDAEEVVILEQAPAWAHSMVIQFPVVLRYYVVGDSAERTAKVHLTLKGPIER